MKAIIRLLIPATMLATAGPGYGGVIVWDFPRNISGNADVSTNGTLVGAVNIGDLNAPATTVNGVTFTPFPITGVSPITDPTGRFTLAGPAVLGFGGFGVNAAPFNTLSPACQTLLTGGDFGTGNSLHVLTMNNLTPGTTYEFEFWVNDSRASVHTITGATAGNMVTADGNVGFTVGGTGQFAIGTFIADATTQVINFQGVLGGTIENAFQLRIAPVPEPGSGLLVLVAVAAVARRRRRAGSTGSILKTDVSNS